MFKGHNIFPFLRTLISSQAECASNAHTMFLGNLSAGAAQWKGGLGSGKKTQVRFLPCASLSYINLPRGMGAWISGRLYYTLLRSLPVRRVLLGIQKK